jgi:hypothetical protein
MAGDDIRCEDIHLGIPRAKEMPQVDVILTEVPDEVSGYGSKGVGEIGCVADAPAVVPLLPKSRRKELVAAD